MTVLSTDEAPTEMERSSQQQPQQKPRPQQKLRVGVIFGGRSGEHEVSMMSARSVMSALDPEKYDVVMIGITKTGRWLTGNVMAALESGRDEMTHLAALLPDPEASSLMAMEVAESQPVTLSEVTSLDVVFPVLHGPYGEDGTVQGLLELAGLPYIGAGVVGSAVGMDKAIFKSVIEAHGLPTGPWRLVLSSRWHSAPEVTLDDLEQALPYPMFTKPANLGSSVGVNKCMNRAELRGGLDEAATYDRRIVVEQAIDGRELEVSVLGNDDPIASVVGEIRPRRVFYDYIAKYVSDDSELIVPAELEPQVADHVRALAVKAFRAIDCAGLGRVDFLLERGSGKVYVSELNTIPGFTEISMYPKLWQASGVSYSELLDRLIDLALQRYEEKASLKTTFAPDIGAE